jgi:Xaa-Pro aminopeptidase
MNGSRAEKLWRLMRQEGLRSAVTCDPSDIFYFTGIRAEGAYLVFRRGEARLFLNSLYPLKRKWTAPLAELKKIKLGETGIEPSKFSLSAFAALQKMTGCKAVKKNALFARIRAVKEPGEIKKIDEAQKISLKICNGLRLRAGMSEKETASRISYQTHLLADGPSFAPIAAFGANSAFPHHTPGGKKYSRGETALIDMGVIHEGYHADLTRMKGLFNMKTLLGKAYRALEKARAAALPHIVPGAEIGGAGRRINEYLAGEGFEKNTLHSAGHGVGLDVHEWPAINCREKAKFEKGMVFTLEPGLYFGGIGGVRLEDIYVLEDKARILG